MKMILSSIMVMMIVLLPDFSQADLPSSFDLRDYNGNNYVTSVKSQTGGTCWTHGTMAAMESNLLMTGNWTAVGDTGEPNLAEYHLDWWNGFNQFNNDDTDPPTGGGLTVHEGGDYLVAAAYLSRGEGAVRDIDGQSFYVPPIRYDTSYHIYYPRDIEFYVAGTDLSNIDLLKTKIMSEGALGTCMAFYEEDDCTFYTPPDVTEDPVHAIAIIGWNDDKLTPAPLPGAWLCKNSWGEQYCDNGYFWISYYDQHCGQHPEMGAVSFQDVELTPYDRIYYHDYHGWRDTKDSCTEAFNAFTAGVVEGGEVIRAVSFYTAVDNVSYIIRIYDAFDGSALSGELSTQSGIIDYTGFHTVDLDVPVELDGGDDFYVYLFLSDGGQPYDCTSEIPVLLGADYRVEVQSTASPGQSYYREAGAWKDLLNHDSTANFCIKALTTEEYYIGIGLPDGAPEAMAVATPISFSVTIDDYLESYVPGTGYLYYRYDGDAYQAVPLTSLGGNLFEATLPPAGCGARPEYYLTAQSDGGHAVYDPPGAPDIVHTSFVGGYVEVFADDFENDLGWTVGGDAAAGHWERAIPSTGGGFGEPSTDYDSSGHCWLTANVMEVDVDAGSTHLTSPTIDLSNSSLAMIRCAVWYTNDAFGGEPDNDVFRIYLSGDDGLGWILIDSLGPVSDRGWHVLEWVINDFMTPTDQMRLRFEASDIGAESVVEAAVDAVTFYKYECFSDVAITTDSVPDWTAGFSYLCQLEATGGGALTWSDKDGDLAGTGLTLSPDGLLEGMPTTAGTIEFTAMACDDIMMIDERRFVFDINDSLLIVTGTLPDGLHDEVYSQQLEAGGGTGERLWVDRDGDLAGSGLSLSSDGSLSGQPNDTGLIAFTARVEDAVGAYDEKVFSLDIRLSFICGDVNFDTVINILDITCLINYLYKDGPSPIPLESADVNNDTVINILDITYLIDYIYMGGPEPNCPER